MSTQTRIVHVWSEAKRTRVNVNNLSRLVLTSHLYKSKICDSTYLDQAYSDLHTGIDVGGQTVQESYTCIELSWNIGHVNYTRLQVIGSPCKGLRLKSTNLSLVGEFGVLNGFLLTLKSINYFYFKSRLDKFITCWYCGCCLSHCPSVDHSLASDLLELGRTLSYQLKYFWSMWEIFFEVWLQVMMVI